MPRRPAPPPYVVVQGGSGPKPVARAGNQTARAVLSALLGFALGTLVVGLLPREQATCPPTSGSWSAPR